MTYQFFAKTNTGRVRNNNEDSVVFEESHGLVILADGMGGYNAGEVASGMATESDVGEQGQASRSRGTDREAADRGVRRGVPPASV